MQLGLADFGSSTYLLSLSVNQCVHWIPLYYLKGDQGVERQSSVFRGKRCNCPIAPRPVLYMTLLQPLQSLMSTPRFSLRSLLIVPFVLQTLGTVGLVGFLSFRNGQAAVQDMATQLREESSLRVQEHLEQYLGHPMAAVQSNAAAANLGQLDLDYIDSTRAFLWQQTQIFPTLDGVYLADESGRFFCICAASKGDAIEKIVLVEPERQIYSLTPRGERGELLKLEQYDPRQRPWYQKSEGSAKPVWSDIYTFTDGELGITAAAQFGNGVAGVDLRLAQINEFLKGIEISPHSEIFITEQSGHLIGSSVELDQTFPASEDAQTERQAAVDSDHLLVQTTARHLQDAFGELASIQVSQQSEFRHDGDRHFVQVLPYRNGQGLDWRIVVVVPAADFMGRIHANTRTTLLLCFLALMGSTLLGLILSRGLSSSIERTSQAAVAVAGGNFDRRLSGSYIREVELLARAFNRMGYRLSQSFAALEESNETLERRVKERTAELRKEHERAEKLLLNILPQKIAEQLKRDGNPIARSFDQATILFADIVGFTPLAARYSPKVMVEVLNRLFCEFDNLAERHNLEKIKTIGDSYMVAAGLPEERDDHAVAIADMALDMQRVLDDFSHDFGRPLQLRIGINSGKVVAGVIGKKKFIYDLWGDSVNVASRMESSGEPGQIQISQATYLLLQDEGYGIEHRGQIKVKGKGLMTTYWLRRKELAPLVAA